MSAIKLTEDQLTDAREQLGLAPAAPELVIQAELMIKFGLANDLIAEVDRLLQDEIEYLVICQKLGWRWQN